MVHNTFHLNEICFHQKLDLIQIKEIKFMDFAQTNLRTSARRQTLKRRYNSEDPSHTFMALKRTKKNIILTFNFDCKAPSTPFFSRPFNIEGPVVFSVPKGLKLELSPLKTVIIPCEEKDFHSTYKTFIDALNLVMGHQTISNVPKEKKPTAKEEKSKNLFYYFESGFSDISFLNKMTKLSKPTIKNAWKKYQKGLEVVKDYRGKAKVLNEDQIEFIKQYFSNNRNFDKNVMNLHSEMIAYFGLNDKSFSFWTLYDYLEGLSFSYKKIIYKNNNANTTKVKDKRLETALKILGGHLQSLDFIYIDETSFNLDGH